MDKAGLEKGLTELAEAIVSKRGFELVAAELAGSAKNLTVKVFIDKDGGVTVDDCASVSRDLSERLDERDLIPAAYTLEVSSPGLDRPLKNLADFTRFAGSLAKLRTHEPIDGQRNFSGSVVGVEGDEILFDDKTSGRVRIPHSAVAKANLEIDLEAELGRRR